MVGPGKLGLSSFKRCTMKLKSFLHYTCLVSGFISMFILASGFGLYAITRDSQVAFSSLVIGVIFAFIFLLSGIASKK
jgi:hypothetical protein